MEAFAIQRLFLKIGEEVPPPQSSVLVVLDAGISRSGALGAFAGEEVLSDYLDELVASCAVFCLAALGMQKEVILSFSGLEEPKSFYPGMEKDLLMCISQADFSEEGKAAPIPRKPGLSAFIFSLPSSPSLPLAVARCRNAGYPVKVLFRSVSPVAETVAANKISGFFHFLFIKGELNSTKRKAERFNGICDITIRKEMGAYRKRGYETEEI